MSLSTSLTVPTNIEDLVAPPLHEELVHRLDDPQVASSLSTILDHVDLIAVLVSGIDGLIRRVEVIGDSMASGVAEIREMTTSSSADLPWPDVDVKALTETVTRLSSAAIDAAPAAERLLNSPLTDPRTVDVLIQMGEALLEGKTAAAADPRGPKGIFALMKVAKDPDVSRGLGLMIQVAKAFGKKLDTAAPEHRETGKHSAR